MFIETLENRQLFAASAVAALAQARTVDTLAQSTPGAVAEAAKPATPAPIVTPGEASAVAAAAQAGTVKTVAKSAPGAVAAMAKP